MSSSAVPSRDIDLEPVVVAILAKDKAHVLPLYLKCLLQQTFPKTHTHLYIRTNDNVDNTAGILASFVAEHGEAYASVWLDTSSVSASLTGYKQHEWCAERFHALAAIRQASVQYAIEKQSHYFVCDCDNFITADCLTQLYGLRNLGAVVGPLLRSGTAYSNYHFDVDENGYFLSSSAYYDVLERRVSGIVKVDVIHCTYFIPRHVAPTVTYSDGTEKHEYVIFSNSLREQGIPQYLDSRRVYGYLTFTTCDADFDAEFERLSTLYLCE